MQKNQDTQASLPSVIADIRAAYQRGDLQAYQPLKVAGVGYDYANCMTSWGPLMKR